jgi:hypothetical protein
MILGFKGCSYFAGNVTGSSTSYKQKNSQASDALTFTLFATIQIQAMDIIPIQFDHEGKIFQGKFHKMNGDNGTVWYNLYIDEFLYGQLFQSKEKGWIFQSNRGLFEEQKYVDLFVATIQAWRN